METRITHTMKADNGYAFKRYGSKGVKLSISQSSPATDTREELDIEIDGENAVSFYRSLHNAMIEAKLIRGRRK